MKIHHLGIAVSDIDKDLNLLGIDRSCIKEEIYDPIQKNKIYFVYLAENNLWLEFVEPVSENSTISKFVKKNGIGLHHLAFLTKNMDIEVDSYLSKPGNFLLGRYKTKVKSFGGNIKTLFIAVKGMIIEFVKCEE